MENAPTTEIICPRCGYDLRGAVQTWTDACPLTGRCTECGLDFSWREVLQEATHPRLFEHQWRKRPIRSLAWTLWTILRPWRFWREVRLVNQVRLRPAAFALAAAALLLIVLVYGQGMAWVGIATIRWETAPTGQWNMTEPYLDWIPEDLNGESMMPMGLRRGRTTTPLGVMREEVRHAVSECAAAFALPFLMPLAFVLIPLSLIEAKVRPAHVLRVAVYSLAHALAWVLLWTLISFTTLLLLHLFQADWFDGAGVLMEVLLWGEPRWGWSWGWGWSLNYDNYSGLPWDRDHFILLGALTPLTIWWGFACSRYLKLRHPWWVALALSVVVLLAAVLLHVSLSLV